VAEDSVVAATRPAVRSVIPAVSAAVIEADQCRRFALRLGRSARKISARRIAPNQELM
jgi:hypothetical protein